VKPLPLRSIAPPAFWIHPDPPEPGTPCKAHNAPDLPPDFEQGYLVQCLVAHRALERKRGEAKRAAFFAAKHAAAGQVAKSEQWAAIAAAAEAESAVLAENYFKTVRPTQLPPGIRIDAAHGIPSPHGPMFGACDTLKERIQRKEIVLAWDRARKKKAA
jgi:hypothetical protein